MKKILIFLGILAVLLSFSIHVFSLKAPGLLRSSIEKSLNKKVIIESIDYRFPWTFKLVGFEVRELDPFLGETSFSVDEIILKVSPLSLSRKMLIVDRVEVENASIVIRQRRGKLYHSLSSTIKKTDAPDSEPTTSVPATTTQPARPLPLAINHFIIKKSNFKFIDYDAQANGFVIVLSDISADLHNIQMPIRGGKTVYTIQAILVQGRDERPAEVQMSGWTEFSSKDTEANLVIRHAFLPYFSPYYAQVTAATISSGYLDARSNLVIDKNDLTLNADLEILGLLFRAYESDNQLFGLKADEILSFLKDRSGRLKFQISARWNLADRSTRPRDVIRKSIERSLKNTVIGNIGNILENTLQKLGEGNVDEAKDKVESTLKKIKDLLKY